MSKSRVRFRTPEGPPLDVIARTKAGVTPATFIERYEASRRRQWPPLPARQPVQATFRKQR